MTLRFWRVLPERRSVIVNTTQDKSYKGFAWDRRDGFLVMRQAHLLLAGGGSTALDGEVLIPEDAIEIVQVLP